MMMDVADRRVQRAAESIQDNERLTADLDDAAAAVLLDWGVSWATMIAESTLDQERMTAWHAMKRPLKATRRMMRAVNRWASDRASLDVAADAELLGRVYEQAARAVAPELRDDEARRSVYLTSAAMLQGDPAELIAGLRVQTEMALGQRPLLDAPKPE